MNNKFPKKRFGQHYLLDDNIAQKIIREISPEKEDIIIEIGSGEGSLTSQLINKSEHLFAVEIDKQNIEILKNKFLNIKLLNIDFLKMDLFELHNKFHKKIRIVGNIPYNITSPILFKLIENREIINDSILMIQYEVAKRIIAQPGNKDYGILSVILQYFTDVRLCFKISPNVFYPRPKVHSALIQLTFKKTSANPQLDETLIKIVKAAFGNRRKMLSNSFKNSIFSSLNFDQTGIDMSQRAEQLTLTNYVTLAEYALEKIRSSH